MLSTPRAREEAFDMSKPFDAICSLPPFGTPPRVASCFGFVFLCREWLVAGNSAQLIQSYRTAASKIATL